MASMSSLSIATSGLRAAQAGLSITGHNISNVETRGYSRQRVEQSFFKGQTVGQNAQGKMEVGMGTDVSSVRRIRNKFYDAEYRKEVGKGNFYAVKYMTGEEVQNIMGELEGEYKAQNVLSDIWDALNELSIHPDGIETRGNFIQTCVTFLNKIDDVSRKLFEHQINLNDQIKGNVTRINTITKQISEYNSKIAEAEVNGNKANDYRDSRDALLDELGELADVTIKNNPVTDKVEILLNGKELLVNDTIREIGLKYTAKDLPFVEPVFTDSKEILSYDEDVKSIYQNLGTENLSEQGGKTTGQLKGLLISRGNSVGNHTSSDDEVGNFLIPKVQKEFDTLVNGIVTLLNDAVAPLTGDKPFGLDGSQGTEIFVRKSGYDRYGKPVDENDPDSLYTIGNIEINPEILKPDGYNKLAFSKSGERGDVELINDLKKQWKNGLDALDSLSIDDFYKEIISGLAMETQQSYTFYDKQNGLLAKIENDRMSTSGVSLDEELTSMLKYQHAYNASAKVINVIDGMIDKIVNQMIR